MQGAIRSFPDQIKKSFDLIKECKFELTLEVNKIIFLGMGGSAIGGDCVKSILNSSLDIPIYICRAYEIPSWVDKNTLVITCSYSGNTEETLSALSQCFDKTENIIAITTGGRLLNLANERGIPYLLLPSGFQPRAAIGLSITINLLVLNKLKLIPNTLIKQIFEAIEDLENFSISLSHDSNPAYVQAAKMIDSIPIIYGSSGFGDIIGLRFANQISENSKILSFSNSIPEQNHNEIEGWTNNYENKLCAVFIKDVDDNTQVKKRQKILGELISDLNIRVFDLKVDHDIKIVRFLKLIHMVDWISFYLAILHDINPSPVETIERFKLNLLDER